MAFMVRLLLSYSSVKEWAKQFHLGRESVEDKPREGQSMEVVTEENIRQIEEELLSDRRLKLKEISVRLEIPKTTLIRIIHEHLCMKKVSARWVPRLLSSIQKEHRLTCCQKILALCCGNKKQVLESVVTGYETMVLYYDPLSKRETRRSTAKKGQGHSVHQEDHGNDLLGLQRNFD